MKITAFGYLAEIFGQVNFELENIADISGLRNTLEKKFPELKKREYKIAVDKDLVQGNILLNETSEVVLLPPFAGG